MEHRKIQGIQNLRGICVLLTVFAHLPLTTLPFVMAHINAPYLIGVSIFYGISGWIIAFVTDGLNFRSIFDFYIKRFFRIVPILYCSLILSLLLAWLLPHSVVIDQFYPDLAMTWHTVYQNLTFTADLGSPYPVPQSFMGLWSVSVEMQFYAVYGFLLFFNRRLRLIALFVLLALIVVTRWNAVANANPLAYSHAFYIELFALGAISYHLKNIAFNNKPLSYLAWSWIFIFPCLELRGQTFLLGYYALCLSIMYVVNYMVNLSLKTNALNKAFTWLGERSYVLYVFHFQFLAIAGAFGQYYGYNGKHMWKYHAILVLGLLIGLPITNFLHQTVEKRGIRLGKKISALFSMENLPVFFSTKKPAESTSG